MEHTHFEDSGDFKMNALLSILGYTGAFWGSVWAYGEKMLAAFVFGFIGAAAGIICRVVYNKYIKKHIEK